MYVQLEDMLNGIVIKMVVWDAVLAKNAKKDFQQIFQQTA